MIDDVLNKFANIDAEERFPGAQPKSFNEEHIGQIQMEKTIVCEKTDGVRYFLLETANSEWFLVNRQYEFRQVLPNYDLPLNHAGRT